MLRGLISNFVKDENVLKSGFYLTFLFHTELLISSV